LSGMPIYRSRNSIIGWTAVELMIMLRKRLEIINERVEKINDEIDRYYAFMESFYPEFPKYIDVIHEKKTFRFETVYYILRHTFWRPRDVLFYMAELLARLEECKKRRRNFSAEIIRASISSTTYEIIRSEFIGEMRSICPNIDIVVRAFEKCQQIMEFNTIGRILATIEIRFVHVVQKVDTVIEKIKFLYSIGFIGLGLNDKLQKEFRTNTGEIFSFSDADRVIESANLAEFQEFKYIIHPIFCEFLRLDTSHNDLVLQYTTNYIRENDHRGYH
jgi:hypothetical protein